MVGTMAAAKKAAKRAAEPVTSNTYMERARSSILFPRREIPCPVSKREKVLVFQRTRYHIHKNYFINIKNEDKKLRSLLER